LEQVSGVGEKSIAKLLREFGSLERVKQASPEELAKVVGPVAARRLREFYNEQAARELKVLS
jgi:excinuclease ABC subunit C